jgi:hypothetical protein
MIGGKPPIELPPSQILNPNGSNMQILFDTPLSQKQKDPCSYILYSMAYTITTTVRRTVVFLPA